MKRLENLLVAALTSFCLLTITVSCAAQNSSESAPPSEPSQAPNAPAEGNAEKEPTLDEWLTKLENKAKEIKTLTAELRYDRINELLDSKEIRKGMFFYQAGPPRKFAAHFTFQLSNRRGVKIDKWWIYDAKWLVEKNVTDKFFKRYEVAKPSDADEDQTQVLELGEGPFAIPIDFNKKTLLKKFNVELMKKSDIGPKNSIHLRLTPRHPEQVEETYFDLWYDRHTLLPTMVETVNEDQETRSIFKLTKPQLNQEIEAKIFNTTPPKGNEWTIDEQRS